MEIVPRERRIQGLLDQRFEWTQRQHEVLDLIARGKTNQEVADTLGISLDGAKWHMREILSKLNVDSREEAAEYWRRRNGWLQRSKRATQHLSVAKLSIGLGLAGAAAALAGVAAILVVLEGRDKGSPKPPAAALDTASPSPPVVLVNGRRMLDLGQFFDVDGESEPVADWEARETLLVVTLKGDGRLRLDNGSVRWQIYGRGPGVLSMYASAGRLRVTMNIVAVDQSALFGLPAVLPPSESPSDVAFEGRAGARPTFVLSAFHGEGPYGSSPAQKYHASINELGHLFLAQDMVADSRVIDPTTGEAIDTTGARSFGFLAPEFGTRCDLTRCTVTWWSGTLSLKAPVAGTLQCAGPDRLELSTEGITVEFQQIPRIAGQDVPRLCTPGESRPVPAGEEIGPAGIYDLSARSTASDPLSLGVTSAGEILIGSFRATSRCPCSDGSTTSHGLAR